MNKLTFFILALLLSACHSLKIVEPPKEVALRLMAQHSDSCTALCNRYVYSKLSCDEVQLKDKHGKVLPISEPQLTYDSACFTCNEISRNSVLMNTINYLDKQFSFSVYADGNLSVYSEMCYKPMVNLLEKRVDSTKSVVFWNRLNPTNGLLWFYTAIETYSPPYYLLNTVDSFSYDLSNFCSSTEQEEERKGLQSFYNKYVKAQVTPNPFEEQFEFTVSAGKIAYMVRADDLKVTFYDDLGTALTSKPIVFDKPFLFSFPQIKPGKTIYYRVTWSDYFIAGQIVKR